jgi:dTDP-4-amino-4,6-dideoxygalactose transaminase
MLTHVSSPVLQQWMRLISFRRIKERELLGPWSDGSSNCGLLSRSTWSLALICHWRIQDGLTKATRILVPDFFCESALMIVRALGSEIFFYTVTEDGCADLPSLRRLCIEIKPDLLVMVHYFGVANMQSTQFREIAQNNGAWLIEDCAHSVSPNGTIGHVGDFALFSPHKLLPIPSGAVLVARKDGPSKLSDSQIGELDDPSKWADQIFTAVRATNLEVSSIHKGQLVWLCKRILQRIGMGRSSQVRTGNRGSTENSHISLLEPMLPNFSKRMLLSLVSKPKVNVLWRMALPGVSSPEYLDRFAANRRKNLTIWDEVVAALSNETIGRSMINSALSTPYLAAYEGETENVKALFDVLSSYGIPVCTWPDFSDEITNNPDDHQGALSLKNRRIYLPVHHSIKPRDLDELLRTVKHKKFEFRNNLESSEIKRIETWNELLTKIELSNVLQSWEYGEAKQVSEGWKVRRIAYFSESQPVAICQILDRRIFGIFKISRISRGPLFLSNATAIQRSTVLDQVVSGYSFLKFRLLSISPEIEVGLTPLPLSGLAKLQQISPIGTESAVLSLTQDVQAIRNDLESKWRNQLNVSEKSGAQVIHSERITDLEWFEEMYDTVKTEKGFPGIPGSLFRNVWKYFHRTASAHLFICRYENRKVGAVLLVTHGSTATYLAGWNGSEGRKIHANNLLLWNASCHLKLKGYRSLDLGGLDSKLTPTIAAFKLGMRGRSYTTFGEFARFW